MTTADTTAEARVPAVAVDDAGSDAVRAAVLWTLLFGALVALRLALPFAASDLMTTHARIADSILHGQSWGRQALVSSFEFPPLPTVALLLCRQVALPLGLRPQELAVALAQAWLLCCVLRLGQDLARRAAALALGAGVLLVPAVRGACLSLDPYWVSAVPAVGALCHAVNWCRHGFLRDAVVAAAHVGVLVFCGLSGLILGLALITVMRADVHRLPGARPTDKDGLCLLLWAPFVYGLVLGLLANWLVMEDLSFAVQHLWSVLASSDADVYAVGVTRAVGRLPLAGLAAALGLTICAAVRELRRAAGVALVGVLALMLAQALLDPFPFLASSGQALLVAVGLLGCLLPVLLLDWRRHCYVLLTALAVPLTTAALGACGVGAWHNEDAVYMTPAPAREQIVGWIDRFWPQSRVLIYGVQGPAVYPDPAEKRFLGRVDFCEPLFLGQARDEQIHLLVPPCDGRFYPLSGVAMADIHRNGRPWLLLERVWPGGWQLWRCVLPPVTESKLRPLERRPRPAARQ